MSFALRLKNRVVVVYVKIVVVVIVDVLTLDITFFQFENSNVIAIVLKRTFDNAIRFSHFIIMFKLRSM